MLAFNITMALSTSIMAFILGVLIGTSLGYLIWADRDETENGGQKGYDVFGFLRKNSPTKQQRRGDNEPK